MYFQDYMYLFWFNIFYTKKSVNKMNEPFISFTLTIINSMQYTENDEWPEGKDNLGKWMQKCV